MPWCHRLADEEPQSNQVSADNDGHLSEAEGPRKWVLTKEAFDKLLKHFSPDRDEAAKLYEAMRLKLTRFFEWRSSLSSDADVDETFNRVARRIDEGEEIHNLNGYFLSVARLVFLESLKRRERSSEDLDKVPDIPVDSHRERDQKEARLVCLDEGLSELSHDERELILEYYREEKHAKIVLRKMLADDRGITLDALRIRACRIRKKLEADTRKRLSQHQ